MQVQVINAFTREVCKGGEWVMPEAPDPTVGLTPTSGAGRTRGSGGTEPQPSSDKVSNRWIPKPRCPLEENCMGWNGQVGKAWGRCPGVGALGLEAGCGCWEWLPWKHHESGGHTWGLQSHLQGTCFTLHLSFCLNFQKSFCGLDCRL